MFRTVLLFSILAVALSQYSRQRAPPRGPPPEYEDYEEYPTRSHPPTQSRPQAPPPPPRVNPNSMRLKPASVHYVNIGTELAGDYKFGYDTGKADDGQSFREETRLPDGTVQGAYGYVDETGTQRIVKYVAGKEGFRVLKDGEDASNVVSSRPASPSRANNPPPQAARAPAAPAYNPPPQPARAPAPQPARAPPAAAYVPAPQPARVPSRSSVPVPQPARSPPAQSYSPPPQQAYRPPPQPAYRPAPAPQRSYSPEPEAPQRSRGSSGRRNYAPEPAPRRRIPDDEPDYDYPDNDIQERRLVPVDTSLFNYNIGTNKD